MLPSYIIQDGSALNGCAYDCRPRYWISIPTIGCCGQWCNTYTTKCMYYEPYIICGRFSKNYAYDIQQNKNYSCGNGAVNMYGEYVNKINPFDGINIECCGYCFCNGTRIKYVQMGAGAIMTSTGCGYCAVCICYLSSGTNSLSNFYRTLGCGCTYRSIVLNDSSQSICCYYKLSDPCLPILSYVDNWSCNNNCVCTYLNFGIFKKDPLLSYICCEDTGSCIGKRDVVIALYGNGPIVIDCRSIYLCGNPNNTSSSCLDINIGVDVEGNKWYSYYGRRWGVYMNYQWCCCPSSSTLAYIIEGDFPSKNFNCVYNNCNTTITKIWRLPVCLSPYSCAACGNLGETVSGPSTYDICKIKNFYIVNRNWFQFIVCNSAVCICNGTHNPTPYILDTNNNKVYTVFHGNKCDNAYCNWCLGWDVAHFVSYTTRNTFLVANFVRACGSLIRVFEYSCDFTPISGCCFGINQCYYSPKFLYDCIEDSLLIFYHPQPYTNPSDFQREPYISKIPANTGMINNFICAQDCCFCNSNVAVQLTTNCTYKNNHPCMSVCLPTVCVHTLNPTIDILCGTSGCYCGYISVPCMSCCGNNNIGKYFFKLPIFVCTLEGPLTRGIHTPCYFYRENACYASGIGSCDYTNVYQYSNMHPYVQREGNSSWTPRYVCYFPI